MQLFGAQIASGVVIKPGVRVKFPWRLAIGSNTWIGEDVWIDNLDHVVIGANCCVSQGAYICTGNHDWSSPTFDLVTKPIVIRDAAWIGARAVVAPGLTVGEGAVLAMGSVAMQNLEAWRIYVGVPAKATGARQLVGANGFEGTKHDSIRPDRVGFDHA